MAFARALAAAAAALSIVALGAPAHASETVRVAEGMLRGATAGAVTSFKGVPFAAPPVGDLRWRPPAPAAHWSGVRDATAYGPACIQMGIARSGGTAHQSEDCLYLNVWTPASFRPGEKLPVMVWIHGGAFIFGTGGSPFYDGTHFAERGVVLVTLNYRLGRLGFFAHPALTAENPRGPLGDYGIMDNIAALKWVKANIAAFGGDPRNVTIFGESAGGILVNWLMTAPDARGLFQKAISESGFGRDGGIPIRGEAPRTGEAVGERFAASVGVTGTGPAAAKALRALTVQQLAAPVSGLADPAIPSPMVDGVLIPEPPPEAWAQGKEASVPYIAGGNSWEASLFPEARRHPEAVLVRAGSERSALAAAYGASDPATVAMDATTESTVIEPDRYLARLHAAHGDKAWTYYFSYVPEAERAEFPGAGHGSEIIYVFNNLSDHPVTFGGRTFPAATPQDHKIADAMTAYWVAFAKSSNPDSAGGVLWRPTEPGDVVLQFGEDGVHARPGFHKTSLDLLQKLADRAGR